MKKFFRASNVVLLLLCAMYFITYLDRVNVSTAADGFGKEFGLSKTQIGLVFSAFAYPYLVFQIVGGWVSDRFGARRTLRCLRRAPGRRGHGPDRPGRRPAVDAGGAIAAGPGGRRDVSGVDRGHVALGGKNGVASPRASRTQRRASATPWRRQSSWR